MPLTLIRKTLGTTTIVDQESETESASESPSTTPAQSESIRFSQLSLGDKLVVLLGTGLGVGFIPFAPGTFGSLWGPLMIWGVQQAGWSGVTISVVAILSTLIGIPICTRSSQALGKHDPGSVVYDEIAAFWIVYLPLLVQDVAMDWKLAVSGFVLFRIFDISKPWPVNRLEKLPDGTGIMVDDLAAGAFAAIGVAVIVFTM